MKALLIRLLGVAKIIANYLFSKEGRTVLKYAAQAVQYVRKAEALNDGGLAGYEKFEFVLAQATALLKANGEEVRSSTARKIAELAHGAWEQEEAKAAAANSDF